MTTPPRKSARQSVQSAETGAEILKALARLGPAATLKRLSEAAGMPPAKAHRYLQAMISSGLATQDLLGGQYRLGPEAVFIGLAAIGRMDSVATVTELLPALRDDLGHTCFLAVWGNRGVTVVRVLEALGEVTVVTRVGAVLPLLHSATGLLYAALQPPDVIADADPEAARLLAAARKGTGSPLASQLDLIRSRGMSVVHGALVPGIDAVAAPVFDASGRIVGAITVLGPNTAFDASDHGRIVTRLEAAAAIASRTLGAPEPAVSDPAPEARPVRRASSARTSPK